MSDRPLQRVEISRRASLHPDMQSAFDRLRRLWLAQGWDCFLACGLRSFDEQRDLYEQGRTKPGSIVTHAPPGLSAHNYGMAVDVAFCHTIPRGQPTVCIDWDKPLAPLGALVKGTELVWGGVWSRPDENHFQLAWHGLTLDVMRQAYPEGWREGTDDPEAWVRLCPPDPRCP